MRLENCGSTWCDPYVGCRGHVIAADFQNTSDVGSVYVDGQYAFGGGDTLMDAVGDIVADLWADEPKYFATDEEFKPATIKPQPTHPAPDGRTGVEGGDDARS